MQRIVGRGHDPADHAGIFRDEKSRIMRLLREHSYTLSIRDRRGHAPALHWRC